MSCGELIKILKKLGFIFRINSPDCYEYIHREKRYLLAMVFLSVNGDLKSPFKYFSLENSKATGGGRVSWFTDKPEEVPDILTFFGFDCTELGA